MEGKQRLEAQLGFVRWHVWPFRNESLPQKLRKLPMSVNVSPCGEDGTGCPSLMLHEHEASQQPAVPNVGLIHGQPVNPHSLATNLHGHRLAGLPAGDRPRDSILHPETPKWRRNVWEVPLLDSFVLVPEILEEILRNLVDYYKWRVLQPFAYSVPNSDQPRPG